MTQKFTSDIVIGLEIHVQLDSKTKLFCGCPTRPKPGVQEEPNTRICPICLGHPGSKPTANKEAIEMGLRLALALNCSVSSRLIFSRKSYFYPDMSKNYQISQYEEPLGREGSLELDNKTIGITRVHLEEDPAALIHSGSCVLVDYNRSGNPLMEIVTDPTIGSPDEAREFMRRLLSILEYLKVYDIDWGILKADANISVRESSYTRVEIKNITGFKEIERALDYECARQKQACQEAQKIIAETRGWDAEKGYTYSMREKESEEDYGYIIDPDLVAITITQDRIEKAKASLPELSQAKAKRFQAIGVKQEDAKVIAADQSIAILFEEVSKKVEPGLAAKWIRRELMRVLNFAKRSLEDSNIKPHHMVDLLTLVHEKRITDQTAQKLMERLVEKPFDIKDVVEQESLAKVSDDSLLTDACKQAIAQSPQAVLDYHAGEEKALNFIVGKVMAATKGKADPAIVKKLMIGLLKV
ncbi:MAG: Asp-tRNA(Asn)/Glu-tRNA(Gln) amidotransferase subunit GatB [Nanoarchaeota archaeon]